jgi:hypothetical protein
VKGASRLAGTQYKSQSILDYQPRRGESLLMQSYGRYEYQNSSVFRGTNEGRDLLCSTDDDIELKKNCSVMEHENYCKKIQIWMVRGYFGRRNIAMKGTGDL